MKAVKNALFLILVFSVCLNACSAPPVKETATYTPEPRATSTETLEAVEPTGTSPDEAPAEIEEPAMEADLILLNGALLTMNPAQPYAEALAVKSGSILAVGNAEQITALAGPSTRVIDLDGMTLMPGFVDSHSHVFSHIDRTDEALQQTQDWLLSLGIVASAEAYTDAALLEWLAREDEAGALRMRLGLYLVYTDACGQIIGDWYVDHPDAHHTSDHLRIPGIKVFTDGGSCNTPAVSFQYADGGNGDLYFSKAELVQIIRDIQDLGYQAVLHALGDRAIETALQAYQEVQDGTENTFRHRLDHNTLLRDDLLPLYTPTGVIPVIFGSFPTCFFIGDMNQFRFRTPEEHINWEWRYGELIEQNPTLRYAWHSDYPVFATINPVDHLYGFVTRQQVNEAGDICMPPDWAADDRIPVEDALQYMTSNAAYAIYYDDLTGTLEPGKRADMIIISSNPLETIPDELRDIQVLATLLDGQVVYCQEGHENVCQ